MTCCTDGLRNSSYDIYRQSFAENKSWVARSRSGLLCWKMAGGESLFVLMAYSSVVIRRRLV